ncbi:DUF1801 domain-containing protein [Lacihabitans sp. LS3-19]|uniref:DUF1801 domain-containing protein n=1 Tax=Lacihabitans sp. LS3-19 TaxID=2487335 RepID=UPI0020CF0A2C|nr:DUF1801 domain-containing protein [Lacihabitans sp. LS3-19]MCP9770358.1 DUF1801 domain-containing protein [Lacihabitans sp. LS3-19]
MKELDKYYNHTTEPNKSCLLSLRNIILKQDSNISESLKYGMPCFLYKNKMFAFLWTDKKTDEPYILMVEGNRLSHPNLEQGDRARMKIFRVNPNIDLPLETIKDLIEEALNLYKSGIIKVKN